MSDERLTIDDIIRAGGCAWGVRAWFNGKGGKIGAAGDIDLKKFLKEGISLEEARALNDGLVNRAIALKERDSGRR